MSAEKKGDILEKGAILQRDGDLYAIAPHIPGGFIDVESFRILVDVAEKYNAKAMKLTSGQRIAVVGIREEDIDAAWADVKRGIGFAIGLCVRMVKFCPGTTYCRHGKQDAMGLGKVLDKHFHGYMLPAKFKIGVAGCEYGCAGSSVKEVGIIGTPEGWTVLAGGNCGARPRLADKMAEGMKADEVVDLTDRIVKFFEGCEWANKMRLSRVIEKIGLDEFKKAVGV